MSIKKKTTDWFGAMIASGSILAFLLFVGVILYLLGAYIVNAYKLVQCDFKAPYTCEVVHAVGLIPPPIIAGVTVWIDPSETEE